MSPLRWMQSTAPHWTVMLVEVVSGALTEVGGADGAGEDEVYLNLSQNNDGKTLTYFPSHSSDRLTGCTPSCIGCIHSDGVVTAFS